MVSLSINESLPLSLGSSTVISDLSGEQRYFRREISTKAIVRHWAWSCVFLLRVVLLDIQLNYEFQLPRTVSCRR